MAITPQLINPVGDTIVLNAPKPVSVNPKVEPTECNNNYPIIVLPEMMASRLKIRRAENV